MHIFPRRRYLVLWNLSVIGATVSFRDHQKRAIPRLRSNFWPAPDEDEDDPPRMSIANMSCDFFTQPLNHFVPRGKSPTFQQRYCVYDGYASDDLLAPIFLYTGNESPLEQYINHTGLMWELAPQFHARIVFVEHRYEGQSLPPTNLTKDCMSYGSTIQALADYADILQLHVNPHSVDNDPTAPVIVFGGSYGGMLSAWMRMKYPHLVAGAIAASAPIGAFPQIANHKIDGSARVLAHGLQQTYPPDKKITETKDEGEEEGNHCSMNLLATWPLITWLVQSSRNEQQLRQQQDHEMDDDASFFLQDVFRLCEPYTYSNPEPLLEFATSLWFDLAEGSFPYPSSYIPFALLHKKIKLPAWPMQAACWTSRLHQDWGIVFEGDMDQVRYNVSYGDSGLVLQIDWDNVKLASLLSSSSVIPKVRTLATSQDVVGLLSSVREAISIWYNITKDVQCYNVTEVAPNEETNIPSWAGQSTGGISSTVRKENSAPLQLKNPRSRSLTVDDPSQTCQEKIKQVGSWEPVCCNDEINLVVTEARGLGHDFFWPPSLPRGVMTYSDMVQNVTMGPCPDPDGIFGYSGENYDPMSLWLDTYYGSSRMNGHSNIIFSNGLLDPWAAGGVFANHDPTESLSKRYDGPMIQNITDNDIIALIIEYGGHHTDLMYSNQADPACVTKARELEKEYISKWIQDWYSNQQNVRPGSAMQYRDF